MNKIRWGLVFVCLAVFGCDEKYEYYIEMKPCERTVERKLVWVGKLPQQERERIAQLYENQIGHNTFQGWFDGNLPNDVGGAGIYACLPTEMGKVTIYSERFRGEDNLNKKIDEMRLEVDQGIDFLIGWLEYELGNDPNFDNLKTFCESKLRQDCKNLIYYFWLADTLEEYEEFGMRAVHYLLERDYFSPQEIAGALQGSEEAIFLVVRKLIADKMGYSNSKIISRNLAFLSNVEHMEKSIERYMPTTDLYKQLWEAKKLEAEDPNVEPPDTGDLMTELVFEFDFFPTVHKIDVKLACDSKPFYTNGQWNAEAGQVVWSDGIAARSELPTFFYSLWSSPDMSFQMEHFGDVVLSGEALAEYCIWQKSLDEEKTEEWTTFVLSLKPGEDLEDRVRSFRFSYDKQRKKEAGAEESGLAEKALSPILAGLKAKKLGEHNGKN